MRHGPEMGPYQVPKTGESLLAVDGGMDPLRVMQPAFNQAQIGQSSSMHGTSEGLALNTITFTISLNVQLQHRSSITVSGLTGTNTTDTVAMPIESSEGLFNTFGSWTRSTGSLIITAASSIPKNVSVTVRFQILNSFYAQEAPMVYARSGVVVDTLLPAIDPYVGRTSPTAMLATQGGMAPLFVEPGFTTKMIGQRSATFNALNMLSVTFAMNTLVTRGSVIIISGLYGASAPSGVVSLHGLSRFNFVSNVSDVEVPERSGRGMWDDIAKSLQIVVVSDIVACPAVCVSNAIISFEVRNPPLAQPSAPVHIEVSGSVRLRTTPMDYGIMGAMLVRTTFVRKVIGQRTFFPDTENIITATLCSNVPLLQRRSAALHISGLQGAVAANGALIPLKACSCPLPLAQYDVEEVRCDCFATSLTAQEIFKPNNCNEDNLGHGVWNSSDFSLSMFLKRDSNVEESVKVEFALKNPSYSQSASQINISARGSYIEPQAMVPFSAETAPIRVVENSFVLKKAGQQSSLPNDLNTVTVTVKSNIPFQPGDVIVISGLVGARPLPNVLFVDDYARVELSANGDSTDFRLFSHDGTQEERGTGSWMQCNSDGRTCNFEGACSSSELHLRVFQSIDSGTDLTFSFPLVNPVKDSSAVLMSEPATLLISATRGSDQEFVKPSSFLLDADRVPDVSVGLQAGEARVLQIRSRSMIISRIAQSENRPGAMNTLSVTLISSVNLTHEAPSAHITIFGLQGARAENGPLQLAGASILHFDSGLSETACDSKCGGAGMGRWDNVMKSLTLRITNEGLGFRAGVAYTFSFTIQNPWNPNLQQAPPVYVGLQIGTYQRRQQMTNQAGTPNGVLGTELSAAMYVEATRFGKYGDTLLATTRIAQDTNAPNAINNITLTFEVNVELVPGAVIFVSGMKGRDSSVHAQTAGGETTVSTELDMTTTLFSVASGDAVLPQVMLDDIYLRIDDEVVKVTRRGACRITYLPCVFSPSNIRGKSNECIQSGECLKNWVQISRGAFDTVVASHAPGAMVSNVLQLFQHTAEIFEPFAAWDRSAGELALAVKSTAAYDTVYSTTFTLRNPADFNPPPSVSIESSYISIGKMLLESPTKEQIPLNVLRPEFIVKNISQSTSFPQGNNSITVELEASVAQRGSDAAVITLIGFTGTTTATNAQLPLFRMSGEFQRDFMLTAVWEQTQGKLQLMVRPSKRMEPGIRYSFSFLLDNPAYEMSAKAISISVSVGTVPIAESRMYQPLIREQQVLHISPPLFIEATAVQSQPYPGSLVKIRLRLMTNTQLLGLADETEDGKGDIIGVSGLLGSLPNSQGEAEQDVKVKITDVHGLGGMEEAAGSYATWSRKRGFLLLELGVGKHLKAGQIYSFEFTLRSPAQAHDLTPEVLPVKPTDPVRDPADTGLYVQANRTGFLLSLEGFLELQEYVLIQKTLMLRNDAVAKLNLEALIHNMGAQNECPMPPLPSIDDEESVEGFQSCPSSSSRCCPSYDDVMPLRTHQPQLLRSTITQSSNLPGDLNQITVRVVANVELFELMICGLQGSQTPGLGTDIAFDEIPISSRAGSYSSDVFGTKGFWTQSSGTLVLRQLSGRASPPGAQHLFTFDLLNPVVGQVAPKIDIHIAYPRPPYEVGDASACQYSCSYYAAPAGPDADPPAGWRCPCEQDRYSEQCNLVAVLASGPLQVQSPTFVYRQIGQQTMFPGASNTITVTIATNIKVETKLEPTITISGLFGSMTPDSTLVIQSRVLTDSTAYTAQTFGLSGDWSQAQGRLTMSLGGNMERDRNYSLAFQLVNSVSCGSFGSNRFAQCPAATTKISISAQKGTCRRERENFECPSEECGMSISDCDSRVIFQEIGLQPAPGTRAPLLIDAPDFLVKKIGHLSSLPGYINRITVSMSFNVELPRQTKVTILGLNGTRIREADNPSTLIDISGVAALFGSTANFNAATGTLSLTMLNRNQRGQLYIMSFSVRNSMTPQDSPEVFIFTTGGDISVSARKMDGEVLFIEPPEFTGKMTGQQFPYPGVLNTITITLTPNTEFPSRSTTITVTGMYGARAPTGNIQSIDSTYPWVGSWNQLSSTLVITNGDTIAAGSSFRIRVQVTNCFVPQESPTLEVRIDVVGYFLVSRRQVLRDSHLLMC